MEPLNSLENGNIPQKRKFSCCQAAFYTLLFVLIIISSLVSVVFCLLHHKQKVTLATESCWAHGSFKMPSTSNLKGDMSWVWNLVHCDGVVQKDHDQYLVIEHSGNYLIYAQINLWKDTNASFALELRKKPGSLLLNKVVGPKTEDGKGTINFARPFFLQKGEKLYCEINLDADHILEEDQTYWGLYKI